MELRRRRRLSTKRAMAMKGEHRRAGVTIEECENKKSETGGGQGK